MTEPSTDGTYRIDCLECGSWVFGDPEDDIHRGCLVSGSIRTGCILDGDSACLVNASILEQRFDFRSFFARQDSPLGQFLNEVLDFCLPIIPIGVVHCRCLDRKQAHRSMYTAFQGSSDTRYSTTNCRWSLQTGIEQFEEADLDV